ncbi:hypothetical protein QLQ12_20480 [Actinoplanes sp. NEAU-A12]|uniref:Secreted protein n=1 Tax=Actinoplanes sandaracinus TaxID=3045177 RepID=A0ABT6WMP1_9ACTN|nr:hypothetical protein [Actinoplanes sandaracinus]MDI6100993.1 hypothetical protein [Actinoplanes sandaracinus]
MSMLKKAVLLATAALTTVAVTGCTGSPDEVPSGSSVSASAQRSGAGTTETEAGRGAAQPTAGEATAGGATATGATATGATAAKPSRTSDPGDGGGASGDAGDGGNWFSALKPCPQGLPTEIQRLERADLTGDGVAEALVARSCEPVTSRWPSTVEIFDGATAEKPRRIGVLLEDAGAGDHPWFTSLTVSGGTVAVKAHGVSPGSPLACPDLKLTYQYRYEGGKFARTDREATKAADCLPIG